MHGGKVKWFNNAKGYGFIVSSDGNKQDLFAHYSDIQGDGYRNLKAGQEVKFQLMDGPKGPQAVDIVLNFSLASAHQ
jgi:CspA family cold shock protein